MLSEQLIQDAFHSYLRSSLTQAKLERLLDADVLSGAEADLMMAGPALCLYFAALRCNTNPPSVPLPRTLRPSLSSSQPQTMNLSHENCPPAFASFLRAWAQTVPSIQSLADHEQHDLARIICGLPAQSSSPNPSLYGIAAELRSVALEISQRRSFQDRYAADLQVALDSGSGEPNTRRVSFVPPPIYEPTSSPMSPAFPPQISPSRLSSLSTLKVVPPPSPTLLSPGTVPAIEFIRETLYAALGDALEEHPYLHTLLTTDPPRAYFASVSLAILSVSTHSINYSTGSIIGVLGAPLTLGQCPPELRPLMNELMGIGKQAQAVTESDNRIAMTCLQIGEDLPDQTVMDRVKDALLYGAGYESLRVEPGRRPSVGGRALAFANRIGRLALGLTSLSGFRERQDMVFQVLAGIGH